MTPEEVHERFRGIVAKVDGADETTQAQAAGSNGAGRVRGGSEVPRVCGSCKRRDGTHTARCTKAKGCVYCQKVYPAKCHHHGGPGWDPTAKKRRARLQRRAEGTRQTGPHAAALAHLDVLIEAARKRLHKLVAAREAWVAVEEEA